MEKNLTEAQVTTILKGAPKGTDPNKIVEGLVSRGYTLQGFNDQPVAAPTEQSSATFKATGQESLLGGTAKAVGNIPSSAISLGKNVVSAVTSPVETVKALGETVVGGASELGRKIGTGANVGKPETEEEGRFKQVVNFIKERYGSTENIKKTLIEDPVGALADFASVLTGGGTAARSATLTKAGQVAEPVSAFGKVKSAVADSTVGKVVSDIAPTSYKMQQGQVVKALELTPGDLSTIQKSTGNDVTNFIVSKDLIKATPEETAQALNDLRQSTKAEVRAEVARVTNEYLPEQIPSVRGGLNVILEGVEGVPGLENVASEVRALAKKDKYTLSDVQRAKEILDENTNLYSKVGDVKSTSKAKGLANIRGELKTFIEKEVDTNTGGKTNIAQLNNDVSTSFAIEDAIQTRVNKGMSRQYLSAFDLIVGTSGTAAFGPLVGAGIVIGKKVAESPALRLKVAKLLSKQPIEFVKTLSKEMADKSLSPQTKARMQSIIDEAQKNLPFIESGATIIEETEE